jgi:hypothetical protein
MVQPSLSTSLLASFATLKGLSDEKKIKSPYQLLQDFIKYIIISEHLYAFSTAEMKQFLRKHFDFQIPEAAIKSAAKKMNNVCLDNNMFKVSIEDMTEDICFKEIKGEAENYSRKIIDELSDYITARNQNNNINKETLLNELICFLIEDQPMTSKKYTDLIGEYVLKNEKDETIQSGLNKIREGSIIYIGLSHNINEIGSVSKSLKLYLGTEILFSLAGYNGIIYKQLANDFYEQVKLANAGNKAVIELYYFSETKKEIHDFFSTAESIVEGKKFHWIEKPAMKAITDGCSSSADVAIKESDFFTNLRVCFGIKEDENDSYYNEDYFSSNLECIEFDEYDENDEDHKRKKESRLKMISHINKLREGNWYRFDLESEYLIVTNSQETLMISKEQTDIIKSTNNIDNICGFAVSLDRITSLLWFKLGFSFSKDKFPVSASALLKARTVLSSSVAQKAYKTYKETKEQFLSGDLSKEAVAARIIALRGKTKLPEELQYDNIEEIIDFSPEYLSRIEEQYKTSQETIKEKDNVIESLREEYKNYISQREATIEYQAAIIIDKDEKNNALQDELNRYKNKEEVEQKKKQRRKKRILFIWNIFWKLSLLLGLACIAYFLNKKLDFKPLSYLVGVVDVVGVILVLLQIIKKSKEKYLN